jgi:uncharacterized membrane protein
MCLAQAADVFGTGIVAGAFFMGTVAVYPAAGMLAESGHVRLRQELIRRLAKYLPPFMLLPIVASIPAMTLCGTTGLRALDALGLALSLTTVGITVLVNLPLNRRFACWSPDTLPRDWQSYIDRWNVAHSARMMTALAAFACTVLAGS